MIKFWYIIKYVIQKLKKTWLGEEGYKNTARNSKSYGKM